MKVKVGDTVTVIAGSDKGKTGKVIKTLRSENRVIVEGVHVVKRHMKPNRMNEVGGIIEIERPIDASNVKLAEGKMAKKAATKTAKVASKTEEKTVEKKATKKATNKKESEK